MFRSLLETSTLSTLVHINRVGPRVSSLQTTRQVTFLRQTSSTLICRIGDYECPA